MAESIGPLPVVCWGGVVNERKLYPSDLSDEQRSSIEPVTTAWKDRHRSVSGHQDAYDLREIVNAILCQGRTRCQRAGLPHDLSKNTEGTRATLKRLVELEILAEIEAGSLITTR